MDDARSNRRGKVGRVLVFTAVLIFLLLIPLCADDDPTEAYYVKEKSRMVKEDLIGRGITSELVLKAMNTVPREDYVLDRYRHRAYGDSPLPIEEGQTISQPYIVAAMTEAILPEPDFVVLEIGTGSGYQAAVLAEIVRHVYTIEIVESLAIRAEQQLKSGGYSNITGVSARRQVRCGRTDMKIGRSDTAARGEAEPPLAAASDRSHPTKVARAGVVDRHPLTIWVIAFHDGEFDLALRYREDWLVRVRDRKRRRPRANHRIAVQILNARTNRNRYRLCVHRGCGSC